MMNYGKSGHWEGKTVNAMAFYLKKEGPQKEVPLKSNGF